jgi:hypothetical protein
MKLAMWVTATLALAAALAGTGTSFAAPITGVPVKGGPIKVWVTPIGNGLHSSIVITGIIGDYGTALAVTANGTPNPNGNYEKVTLHKGTFKVNSTRLNAIANKAQPTVDPTTCSGVLSASGPVTLFDGTGQYTDISGTLHLVEIFAFVGPRYASGPNKGECDETNSAKPLATYVSITGSGSVTVVA